MQQVVKAVDEQGQQGSKEYLQWYIDKKPVTKTNSQYAMD